jgi:hypothetical protein
MRHIWFLHNREGFYNAFDEGEFSVKKVGGGSNGKVVSRSNSFAPGGGDSSASPGCREIRFKFYAIIMSIKIYFSLRTSCI